MTLSMVESIGIENSCTPSASVPAARKTVSSCFIAPIFRTDDSPISDGSNRKTCPPLPSATVKYDGSGLPAHGQPGRELGGWLCVKTLVVVTTTIRAARPCESLMTLAELKLGLPTIYRLVGMSYVGAWLVHPVAL